MSNIRTQLERLLAQRILGTGWRHGDDDPAPHVDRSRLPRRALQIALERAARQQRHAGADAPRDHSRDSRAVPRGRRRHHRDQFVQRDEHRSGRLRARTVRVRAQRRSREAREAGRRQMDDPGQAALRRRRDGADQQDAVDFARRQRPGVPRGHLRPDEGRVRRTGARAHRRRRGRAAHRNDHRHAQRQGCAARGVRRRPRGEGADHPVGDHHRSQRPHALGTNHRRVLGVGDARQAARRRHQLRAGCARDEAVSCRTVARRNDICQLLSERGAAERVRPVRSAARGRPASS